MITQNDILKLDPGLFELIVQNIKIKEEAEKLKKIGTGESRQGICEECGSYEVLYEEDGYFLCGNCCE